MQLGLEQRRCLSAFDALFIDGEDLRYLPLLGRKRRLAHIMTRIESRLMLLEPIASRGRRLFELACERDLEGIVAKWAKGRYQCDGRGRSWLKIRIRSTARRKAVTTCLNRAGGRCFRLAEARAFRLALRYAKWTGL